MNSHLKNQTEYVDSLKVAQPAIVTETLTIPGIDSLHSKPLSIIGETLANVMKSRPNLISLTYTIGEGIELTYRPL